MKKLQILFFSAEFDSRLVVITVPNNFEDTASSQRSLPDLFPITIPITEIQNSLRDSVISIRLYDEMETQDASSTVSSTARNDSSENREKN